MNKQSVKTFLCLQVPIGSQDKLYKLHQPLVSNYNNSAVGQTLCSIPNSEHFQLNTLILIPTTFS